MACNAIAAFFEPERSGIGISPCHFASRKSSPEVGWFRPRPRFAPTGKTGVGPAPRHLRHAPNAFGAAFEGCFFSCSAPDMFATAWSAGKENAGAAAPVAG